MLVVFSRSLASMQAVHQRQMLQLNAAIEKVKLELIEVKKSEVDEGQLKTLEEEARM